MPSLRGAKIYAVGKWTSPTYPFQHGSGTSVPANTWGTLTWSGTEPDTDANIQVHILDAGNSDAYLTGSLVLTDSPYNLNTDSNLNKKSLKIQFDMRMINNTPIVYWYSMNWVPNTAGGRKSAAVLEQSGGKWV